MRLSELKYNPVFLGVCLFLAVGIVVGILWFTPRATPAPTPSPSSTPSATVSDDPATDDPAAIDPAAEIMKNALLARVTQFEVLRNSFNWQQSDEDRWTDLATFMIPETLEELKQYEKAASVQRDMLRHKDVQGVKTASVLGTPVGDIEVDYAEVETEVKVVSTQANDAQQYEDTFLSQTSWVLINDTWVVYGLELD